MEVSLAVLAATSTTSIVFFPVTFLSGISKYIFTPLGLGVVLSIFASYFFAMTVVPLFCANFIRLDHHAESEESAAQRKSVLVPALSSTGSTSTSSAFSTLRRSGLPSAAAARHSPPPFFWADWRCCSWVFSLSSGAPTFRAPIPASL